MARTKDVPHPVVKRSWRYEIVGFNFQQGDGTHECFVDLTLQEGQKRRHLRFLSPRDIEIRQGFPAGRGGLLILDVRARGMAGVAVMVDDFADSHGAVRFWAREVIDLDGAEVLVDDPDVERTQ